MRPLYEMTLQNVQLSWRQSSIRCYLAAEQSFEHQVGAQAASEEASKAGEIAGDVHEIS